MCPFVEIISPPFVIKHTIGDIYSLVEFINSIDGKFRIVIEHIRRYYKVFGLQLSKANLIVSTIDPKLIKNFDNDSPRKVKSGKADTIKIARYAFSKWQNLKQHSVVAELRSQLKTMNQQSVYFSAKR